MSNLTTELDINGYHTVELLARGGSASVYRAIPAHEEREVALKIISLDDEAVAGERSIFRERFAAEARLIASLEHLHIVPIYDYDVQIDSKTGHGAAYISMRLMRGGTLGRLIARQSLPLDHTAVVLSQITDALEYAHMRGIIHCDLKPNNILLDEEGNAYLADFGLARLLQGALSEKPGISGTPAYLAPEQIRCERVDVRTDVYSLGLILYEMLTGQPAFITLHGDIAGLLTKQLLSDPIPPRRLNPSISPDVEAVIVRATQKSPAARYANVREMFDAFERAVAHQFAPRWTSHRMRIAIVGGILTAAMVFLTAAVLSRPPAVPHYFQASAVQTDQTGTHTDTIPNPDEINRAQAALGERGFIAYISCSSEGEVSQDAQRILETSADEYGVRLRTYDGQRDTYTQITQIEVARAEGAREILICALNSGLIDNMLFGAQADGLPVVALSDRVIPGTVSIRNDNDSAGHRIAFAALEHIARDYPNQRVQVIVLENRDAEIPAARSWAIRETLTSANVALDLQVIETPSDTLTAEQIAAITAQHNLPVFLFAYNDTSANAVLSALSNANIPSNLDDVGTIHVYSIISTGDPALTEALQDGRYFRGLININRDESLRAAIHALIKLMGGGRVPQSILIPASEPLLADS